MQTLVLVFLGGGAGSLARYGLVRAMSHEAISAKFPVGLMTVNLLGSLAIGFLAGWLSREGDSPFIHPLIVIGFLGGFTTFSSFSLETVNLLRNGFPLIALTNIIGSVLGGIILAAVGFAIAARA